MRISKLSLIAFFALAAAVRIDAQPASPEQQARALELLRQAMQQQVAQPAKPAQPVHPSPGVRPVQPTPAIRPSITPTVPASASAQERAIQLLRQEMAAQESGSQRAVSPSNTPPVTRVTPKTAPKQAVRTPSMPAAPVSPSQPTMQPGSPGTTVQTPVAPSQPTGPKSKQERLKELLDQYMADKLTPAEYHAQRAKILAEP